MFIYLSVDDMITLDSLISTAFCRLEIDSDTTNQYFQLCLSLQDEQQLGDSLLFKFHIIPMPSTKSRRLVLKRRAVSAL
jgi:hypothetical protein